MSTTVIVGAASLSFPGGVESVCRAALEAVGARGDRAGYVAMSDLVTASRMSRLPGRRHWQGVAESLMSRRFCAADLVVTNGPLGVGLFGRAGTLHMYHGTYAGQANAVRAQIRQRGYLKMRYLDGSLLEGLAGRGKTCVANSTRTAEEVSKYYGLDCDVIWAPVDTQRFRPESQTTTGMRTDGPTVLFAGAGRPTKGDRLARSLVLRFPDVRWLVVGDGFPPAKNVTFAKSIPRAQVPHVLHTVDLVLTPSLYDSFGLLGAEAILSGIPIVTSETGLGQLMMGHELLREWVFHDAADELEAAATMETVLGNDRARRTAVQARNWLASFVDRDVWAKRFLAALERAESQL